jgi:transcriptional regulator with XRE-family HTH domain
MSAQRSPSARQRRLAAILRGLRKEAGLSREQVAEQLGCSPPTITRIEGAQTSARVADVSVLLDIYQVPQQTKEMLLQLARDARKRGWWDKMSEAIPEYFQNYVGLEGDACAVYAYESEYVPGLFQTREYARAVTRAEPVVPAEEDLERMLSIRMKRQERLDAENPPEMWVVLNEAVICRKVGSSRVMTEQLERLADLSALNHVNVQILPFGSGAHPAMNGGFSLLKFPRASDQDLVYLEYWRGGIYLEDPNDIEAYSRLFDHLRARAFGPDESRSLIAQAAERM